MNYTGLIPYLVLALFGILVLILKVLKVKEKTIFISSLVGTALFFGAFFGFKGKVLFFNKQLVLDNLSNLFVLLSSFILLFVFVVLKDYREKFKSLNYGEYESLIFLGTLGLLVFVSSLNLLVIFLGLELFSFSSYILSAVKKDRKSIEAGFKYLYMGIVSSSIGVLGIILIYSEISSLSIELLRGGFFTLTLEAGILLFMINIFFKFSLSPFHVWTPDVYEGSPSPTTLYFSVAPKIAIAIFMVRFLSYSSHRSENLVIVLWVVSVLTILWGNIQALSQKNLKRLMAFSSIAHSGYISMAFLLYFINERAVFSLEFTSPKNVIIYYGIVYIILNLVVFTILSYLVEGEEEVGFESIMGMYRREPLIAIVFALSLVSLSGFPPMIGFYAKFYLFLSVLKAGFLWLTLFAILGTVVSAYYYLKIVKSMFFDEPSQSGEIDFGYFGKFLILISGLVIVFFSLYPLILFKLIGGS